MLTTASARADSWALDVTLGMVAAWSARGRRVVLADVGLQAPSMHGRFAEPNREGVVDVVDFGASVRRVARAAPDGGYFYISAGTSTADAGAVLRSPRLSRLCDGFLDAGVTLVAFAHDECPGTEALAELATDVFVLCARGETPGALPAGSDDRVRLVAGPDGASSGPIAKAAPGLEAAAPAFEDAAPALDAAGVALAPEASLEPAEAGDADEWVIEGAAEGSENAPDQASEGEATSMSAAGPADARVGDPVAEADSAESATGPAPDEEPDDEAPEEDPEAHIFGPILKHQGRDAADDEALDAAFEVAQDPHADADESAGDQPEAVVVDEAQVEIHTPTVDEASAAHASDAEEHEAGPAGAAEDLDLPAAEASIVAAAAAPPAASTKPKYRPVVLLALSGAILGIVGAAALGYVEIPGLSPASPPPTEAAPVGPAARSVPMAESTKILAYSVATGAYQDAGVAEQSARSLAAVEGVVVAVAPVAIDGAVFHRVLVGPAEDSTAAAALAARVAQSAGVNAATWVVRSTPLAFRLGDAADEAAALARVSELRALEVPAYVLPVEYRDGSMKYVVYAGAYADEEEASHLRDHLVIRGLDDADLVTRLGRVSVTTSGSE